MVNEAEKVMAAVRQSPWSVLWWLLAGTQLPLCINSSILGETRRYYLINVLICMFKAVNI